MRVKHCPLQAEEPDDGQQSTELVEIPALHVAEPTFETGQPGRRKEASFSVYLERAVAKEARDDQKGENFGQTCGECFSVNTPRDKAVELSCARRRSGAQLTNARALFKRWRIRPALPCA